MRLTLRSGSETARILLVSADMKLTGELVNELNDAYEIVTADSIEHALVLLDDEIFDLALTDELIGGQSGIEIVRIIHKSFPSMESMLLMDGQKRTSPSEAVACGAYDTLPRWTSGSELRFRIGKAIEHTRIRQELTLLRQQVAMEYGFDNLIGESEAMMKLKETARRVAPTDIAIMITGEAGTGKSKLARIIHHHSDRRLKSFEAFDCATSPEPILEAELFGKAEAGISTSSVCPLVGAQGGTFFLGHIDQLPMPAQSRLVRLFQSSEIIPIGAADPVKVDVRFVASCSHDLEKMVTAGSFRKDLFNHVAVISLELPPLRKRIEDLEPLTDSILRRIATEGDMVSLSIARDAREKLMRHNWPGNIRELESSLKRATTLCRESCIEEDDIMFVTISTDQTIDQPSAPGRETGEQGLLADNQRVTIVRALENHDWNFTRTARALGIGRTTLWRKVKKYDLQSPDLDKQSTS
jgi:two-component system response regulator AtoC